MQSTQKSSRINTWPLLIPIHNRQPLKKDRKNEHKSLLKMFDIRRYSLKPLEPKKLIFISSNHWTWFQQSMCFVDMFSANCLQAFLCIVFRRGFLLGWQPCKPIWCRVRRMVWALTDWPPTSSISAAMLTALIRRSFKESIWMWRSACALSFFGQPTRGLFWVDPALLKCWMILATVLQLSFRVLVIFL